MAHLKIAGLAFCSPGDMEFRNAQTAKNERRSPGENPEIHIEKSYLIIL